MDTEATPKPRGGAREGSGRKTSYETLPAYLLEAEVKIARKAAARMKRPGGGKGQPVAAFLRKAIEFALTATTDQLAVAVALANDAKAKAPGRAAPYPFRAEPEAIEGFRAVAERIGVPVTVLVRAAVHGLRAA